MKKDEIRVPRPLGITHLLYEYHKLPEEEKDNALNKIRNLILQTWFLSNGNICGRHLSMNQLVIFLNVDVQYVQDYLKDQVINNKIWDKDNQQRLLEGLIGNQISWVLEDRMNIMNQFEILKASQNGKYTPFVSAEVNKTLKLLIESSTSMQSLFRTLSGGGGTTNNFFTQINQQQNQMANSGVDYEEVLEIIEETQKSLPESERMSPARYIEEKYDLSGLPAVCALEQEGVNTDKEGLNLNKTELAMVTDNYKGSIEVSDAEFNEIEREIESRYHHEHRRQIEIGEDPDADDPECTIYDKD